jgi:hypothetical protein
VATVIAPDRPSAGLTIATNASRAVRRARPIPAFLAALTAGLAITLIQVVLACTLSGQATLERAYRSLERFDSDWYGSIVKRGYYCPQPQTEQYPGNVAFFPAYPLLAGLVHSATGLPIEVCLPLAAQLACWGLWTYLLLLCRRWRLSVGWTAAAVGLIATHPAAYYLVAGYSESLFLCNLVGFLYWSEKKGRVAACLACAQGFVMTATRLVGVPVVIYPLVRAGLGRQAPGDWRAKLKRLALAGLVSGVAAGGALSFFLYCQLRFGHWDLYMRAGQVGWGLGRNFFVPLKRSFYLNAFCDHVPVWRMNHTAGLVVEAALAALVVLEMIRGRHSGGWRERAGLYLGAAFLWYVPLCACFPGMQGMIRYVLCVQVLLALALAHLVAREQLACPRAARVALAILVAASFGYQLLLTHRFTNGIWVA